MDSLREITRNINVFVDFFRSINCLFWQLGWLEQNFGRSSPGILLVVLIILGFCALLTFSGGEEGANNGGAQVLRQIGINFDGGGGVSTGIVILILLLIIGRLIYRRMQEQRQQRQHHRPQRARASRNARDRDYYDDDYDVEAVAATPILMPSPSAPPFPMNK